MTYYEILEISPHASTDVIRAAYKAMCKKYHPDNVPNIDEDERIKKVNEAYSILIDPLTREEYDKKLADNKNVNSQETHKDDNLKKQPDTDISYVMKEEVGIGKTFFNLLCWIWGGFCILCGWVMVEETKSAAILLACSGIVILPIVTDKIPKFKHKKKLIVFLSMFLFCKASTVMQDSGNMVAQINDTMEQTTEKKEDRYEKLNQKEESGKLENSVTDKADKILSEAKKTASDFLEGVTSGDLSIAGFGGHPRGFTIDVKSCALGETELDDIRKNYDVIFEQGNTIIADVNGYIMFAADSSGKVSTVVTQSKKLKGYKGIKIGMKKKAIEKKLGDPSSVEDNMDYWYYTSEGKLLSGEGYDEDIAIVQAEYIIGASFKSRLFGNGEAVEIFIMNKNEYIDGIIEEMEELDVF